MSSIITGVLDLTFGLLWDKLRDHTAERLQDGDVTDQKCRQIIVRELDDMKSILEGLSRKDLLASISFLKEGVCLLNMAFSPHTDDDNKRCALQDKSGIATDSQNSDEMSNMATSDCDSKSKQNLYDHEQERFLEAIEQLSQIIANLPIASKDRFSSARMSFADARREATRAFNNKALSTKDKILACKLRVISRMLESVEDPRAVVETCMLYLEELHNLEAIQQIFNVHINGGLKSFFNKQKRQELMSSVIMISYVLANFTLSYAKKKYNLLTWPKVETGRGSLHPLLDPAANAIMNEAKIGAPNRFVFDRMHFPEITQHGRNIMPEIMTTGNGHIAEIIIRDGVMQFHLFHSTDEITTDCAKILLVVTSDGLDNVYVVVYVEVSADHNEFDLSLLVADKTGNIICESNLLFLAHAEKKYRESTPSDQIEEFFSNSPTHVEFAVNAAGKISIFGHQTFIYICDSNGVLSHHFETPDRNDLVDITHKNEVITAARSCNTVYVYALDGSMIHQFDVVRGQVICDIVLHHSSHMIYVLTRNFQEGEFRLEIYTHLGEHRGNLELVHFNFSALFALLEGPVAVIYDKGFILT